MRAQNTLVVRCVDDHVPGVPDLCLSCLCPWGSYCVRFYMRRCAVLCSVEYISSVIGVNHAPCVVDIISRFCIGSAMNRHLIFSFCVIMLVVSLLFLFALVVDGRCLWTTSRLWTEPRTSPSASPTRLCGARSVSKPIFFFFCDGTQGAIAMFTFRPNGALSHTGSC